MLVGKGVEGLVDEVAVGLGPFQLFQLLHPLFILDALGLQRCHGFALQSIKLSKEDRPRILQNGFDQREHVKGVGFCRRIEQRQGVDQVERQGVVQREVVL